MVLSHPSNQIVRCIIVFKARPQGPWLHLAVPMTKKTVFYVQGLCNIYFCSGIFSFPKIWHFGEENHQKLFNLDRKGAAFLYFNKTLS